MVMSGLGPPPCSPSLELVQCSVSSSSAAFHIIHLLPPASFHIVSFVVLDPAQLSLWPVPHFLLVPAGSMSVFPSCPYFFTSCLIQPRDQRLLPPSHKRAGHCLGWHQCLFQEEGLEGLDLSRGILGPPASHLAFGLRNLCPAKTALSPRASSILEGRQSQGCDIPTQEPSAPYTQAYCTHCTS